ncbi:MAG: metal-dependent hydrolase [Dehalococcoidales bacterium]
MLLFAHPGITLGAATIIADAANRKPSWFASLSRYLDIRWLLVGSLLPDIIDKPVGQYLFKDTFNNGRIFSHTLLFLIVISLVGYYLLKKFRQSWMLTLAAGTFAHLVLDEMWQTPQTLFWPVLGWSFPKEELEGWASNIWNALFNNPAVYIPEIVGLVVLLVFCYLIIRRKKFGAFIKHGKVI